MKGITLTFLKKVPDGGRDSLNNPTYSVDPVVVDDCLIAPITEPSTAREQQAMEQSRDQVRIHLPIAFTGDVSKSTVSWGGKTFKVDSDSVEFMLENTPRTLNRWNRYIRAESVNG